ERVGLKPIKLQLSYTNGENEDGNQWVNLNFFGYPGGAGAAYETDGWGLYPPVMTGVLLPSIEMNEIQYPSRVLKHEYVEDFPGAGKWRGTAGVDVQVHHLSDSSTGVLMYGVRNTTKGFVSGQDAPSNRVIVNYGTDEAEDVDATSFAVKMPPGGIIQFYRAGGGGWGAPLEREVDAVLDDVKNGYVSIKG